MEVAKMNKQTAKREPITRVLYSNYDVSEIYKEAWEDYIKTEEIPEEEVTDEKMWDFCYQEDEWAWDEFKKTLFDFFEDKEVIFVGTLGLWDGQHLGGNIGDFKELYCKAVKDCDYVEFTDENGHLYLRCSHHDGTNNFEIKIVTDKGYEYYDRWLYSGSSDTRAEEYVHKQIMKKYSRLPHLAHRNFGFKKIDYEKKVEGGLNE